MNSLTNYTIGYVAGTTLGATAGVIAACQVNSKLRNLTGRFTESVGTITLIAITTIGSGLGLAATALTQDHSYKASLLGGTIGSLITPIALTAFTYIAGQTR